MRTAPRDGTLVLVTETPNGEAWNVFPAAFMTGATTGLDNWWGMVPTRYADDPGTLPNRVKMIACRPVCWQPLPKAEPVRVLHRRYAAIHGRCKRST